MDVFPYPIVVIDREGCIVKLNKAAQQTIAISGLAKENYKSPVLETLKTGRELFAEMKRIRLFHQNKPMTYLINTELLKNNTGEIEGAYGLYIKKPQLKRSEIFSSFAKIIEAKCKHIKNHCYKVGFLAACLAKTLGLPQHQLDLVYWASVLHDIGKIGISDHILNKTGPLTPEEFKLIKKHPVIAANILEPLISFKDIVPIIRHHHERFDGKGYPNGLKGAEIPFLSRIVAIADAFEAMTADRCYQKKLHLRTALAELESNSGTQFDPTIVQKFIDLVRGNSGLKEHGQYQLRSVGAQRGEC